MRVQCHQPRRELTLNGPRRVRALLDELQLLPESVLVIRNDLLVTEDELLADEDSVEIRPVISGGAEGSAHAL
jgi:sulfur carrier protein